MPMNVSANKAAVPNRVQKGPLPIHQNEEQSQRDQRRLGSKHYDVIVSEVRSIELTVLLI